MQFTVMPHSTALPPEAPRPKPVLAPLGKSWRGYTSPGTYEPVKAVTADGEWLFERAADGTWMAGHLPTRTEVKHRLRSLRACRLYAGTGNALADLELILAHQRSEHEAETRRGCPECGRQEGRAA